MQEHEYKARDKTVKKMSREGLTEENLRSRETTSICRKEKEDITLPARAEDSFNFQNIRNQGKDGKQGVEKRRRRYDSSADRIDSSGETEENGKRKKPPQRTADLETDQKVSEDVERVDSARGVSEHSSRMESIRGHPSSSSYVKAATEISHDRKKKQVQAYSRKQREKQAAAQKREGETEKENSRFQRNHQAAEQSMEGHREEIREKTKREQLHKEQRKKVSRLAFGDEDTGMVRGAGVGITKKAVSAAAGSAAVYLHGKGHEAEGDNAAVESSHRAELMAENALRHAMNRTNRGARKRSSRWQESPADAVKKGRLQFEAAQEAAKSTGRQAAEMEKQKRALSGVSGRSRDIKKRIRRRRKGSRRRRRRCGSRRPSLRR